MPVEALLPLTVALVWIVVEGRTILVATAALRPPGADRLDRLGWGSLTTESWTLALLGLAHAILPATGHEVYAFAPWATTRFIAGWMVRDIGLWFRRRPGAARGWTIAASTGARLQAAAALAVLASLLLLRPAISVGSGAHLLTWIAPPVLVTGALLQWRLAGIRSSVPVELTPN